VQHCRLPVLDALARETPEPELLCCCIDLCGAAHTWTDGRQSLMEIKASRGDAA